MTDRILTVRQPWATAIMRYGKDVENRTWRTDYRGRLWIHAGQVNDELDDCELCGAYLAPAVGYVWHLPGEDCRAVRDPIPVPPLGHLLGYVTLVDIVDDSPSPWACGGCWHWILENPVPVIQDSRTVMKGALALRNFTPPRNLRRAR